MSLIPLICDFEPWSEIDELLEGPFGLGLHPIDIFNSRPRHRSLILHPRKRYCPYLASNCDRSGKDSKWDNSEIIPTVDKNGFQVCMDVSQFSPNELLVKTVDRTVMVEGKHEEREDEHGFIQRHFIRKYTLPKGFDPKDVVSTISSDGVLTIKAAPPAIKNKNNIERIVQIQQTGPAHLSIKQPEQSKTEEVSNGAAETMETK
uniref:Putative heat shock protein 27 n=1 Tax=Haematobia irritans TaxID=7368 RepID=A0A1L8EIY9_HAEIR